MTAITEAIEGPTTDTNTMISSKGGMDRIVSVKRMIAWSVRPPWNPASRPSSTPMTR